MTVQDITNYCADKPDACITFPFGDIPVCFKVNNKIFCELYPKPDDFKITVKCEPALALMLREIYKGDIVRGYHCPPVMQPHRNTIYINRSVPDSEVYSMIDDSYELVSQNVKKK